jgi:hypothetical protein
MLMGHGVEWGVEGGVVSGQQKGSPHKNTASKLIGFVLLMLAIIRYQELKGNLTICIATI